MIGIFKVTSICPFEYSYSKGIVSRHKKIGYVKLTRKTTVLGIPGLLSIDPHLMSGIYTAEMKYNAATLPVRRNCERAQIRAHRVVTCDIWRSIWERISDICINWIAISIHLPA